MDEYSDLVTLTKPVIYISIGEIINTHTVSAFPWLPNPLPSARQEALAPASSLTDGRASHFAVVLTDTTKPCLFSSHALLLFGGAGTQNRGPVRPECSASELHPRPASYSKYLLLCKLFLSPLPQHHPY